LGDEIDTDRFAQAYLEQPERTDGFLRRVNGEFLLFELSKSGGLRTINSRFASPPCWYVAETDFFLASTSYYHLARRLKELAGFLFDTDPYYLLMRYRRLFREITYDKRSRYLRPAHVLSKPGRRWEDKPYWGPNYSKNDATLDTNARRLQQLLAQAIRRKGSDHKRYGLFLSGGMDTRSILANTSFPLHCFTMAYSENREYQVAHQLTQWKAVPHHWLHLQKGHSRQQMDAVFRLGASMYMGEGILLGHEATLAPHIDVLFSGYGCDYFFQGMYLPQEFRTVFGRTTPFRRRIPFQRDMVQFFLDHASYYAKGFPVDELLKPEHRIRLQDYLRATLAACVEDAECYARDPQDIWEHLSLGAVSRHYTYQGQIFLMSNAEHRTVSYDNDLYKLYLELPADQRFDAKVFKAALKHADPRFHGHISANNGYPVGYSHTQMGWRFLMQGVRNMFNKKVLRRSQPPVAYDNFQRTWPPVDLILRTDMMDLVQRLHDSPYLASVPFLDMDRVRGMLAGWQRGECPGGHTILNLINIDGFLRGISESTNTAAK
jgi:asparagine synthetase B (glutamine-hydrolysing)